MTHLSPGTLSGRFTVGSLGSPRSREEGALQPGGTPPTAPCDFSLSQACPAASFLGFVLPVSGRRKGYVLLPLLVFNPPPPLCSVLCLLLHPRVCLTPLVPSAPSCPREPGLPGRAPGPAVPGLSPPSAPYAVPPAPPTWLLSFRGRQFGPSYCWASPPVWGRDRYSAHGTRHLRRPQPQPRPLLQEPPVPSWCSRSWSFSGTPPV